MSKKKNKDKDVILEEELLDDVIDLTEADENEEMAEDSDEAKAEDAEPDDEDEESDKARESEEADDEDEKPQDKKDEKDILIDELNDKYIRLYAEFQNYRNRSEKEKSSMYEMGEGSVIEKILPVMDNLERGIAALSEDDKKSPVGQGMVMVQKQMQSILEDMGVTPIEAEGKEFDAELHNAILHEENDSVGENIITQELQKGYKYRDTVIRHSLVKVAN